MEVNGLKVKNMTNQKQLIIKYYFNTELTKEDC